MKQLLFLLTLFVGSAVYAAPVKYVQISTGPTVTLQPGTTLGFFVSSGTAVDLNSIRLKSSFATISGTSTFSGTNTFNGGNTFNSWVTYNSSMTLAGSTITYSPLGIITGTKTDNSTTTTTANWYLGGSSNAIRGFTTGSPAGIGNYGQTKSSVTGSVSVPTSAQWGNFVSVTLEPGSWLIYYYFDLVTNGASITAGNSGVTTFPGNDSTGIINGDTATNVNFNTSSGSTSFGPLEVDIAANTTYYLKISVTYTVATPIFRGTIKAVRHH